MAEKIIPVNNLIEFGIIKDMPTVGLAPNTFTDTRNIRLRDGAVWKMKGDTALANSLNPTMPTNYSAGEIVYITWWNNPNLIPTNNTYYIVIVEQKLTADSSLKGHRAFLYKASDGTLNDITPTTDLQGTGTANEGFSADGNWQSTEFAGGFCIILNNGEEAPHYIMDLHGNTTIGNVPSLAKLPAWDSYNTETKILEATVRDDYGVAEPGTTGTDDVTGRNKRLFDLGQKIDFTTTTLFVTKQTPNETTTECTPTSAATNAGSNAPNAGVIDKDFVPGDLPASPACAANNNFQYAMYTDTETNTTNLIFNTNIISKDVVRCYLISRKPITNTCGVIRSFGNLLVAGNLKEVTTDGVINQMPGVVRTSDVAVPGSVPQNWNPFAAGTNTADEFTLSDTSTVQDMVELQGNMYIYTNTSIHNLRLTNSVVTPIAFTPVTSQYGCQTTDGAVEFDGKHLVVGSNDIYLFSGNPGNITSVADARVRDYFYNNLNNAAADNLFVLRNQANDEIWICYPKGTSTKCDEALIYNFRINNWTLRDLNGIVSGVVAPVKGNGTSDADRPWSNTTVNFNHLFPVLAQQCTSGATNTKAAILAADVGYTQRSLANADANYTSYIERESMSVTPEFYTEQFNSVALLAQGSGTLNIKTIASNSPGATIDFSSPNTTGTFNVASAYKSDIRLNGRFLSYRIDDGTSTSTSWSITGMQIAVQEGGTR